MTIPATIAQAATDLASDGWVRVASIADLPFMEGRRTTIDGHRVAVFRLADGLAAIDAVCPHKAGPLQDGLVADGCVTCPLHDRRIDLTTGQVIGHEEAVHVHEIAQHGDDVWVRLAALGGPAEPEGDGAELLVPGDAMSDPHSSVPDAL